MDMHKQPAIVCLAHLGWDFVWQRPQQILSRIARDYPVMYVHEPALGSTADGEPQLTQVAADHNVTAWQPMYPDRGEELERWRENYAKLVCDRLIAQGWARQSGSGLVPTRRLIVWFYTPAPVYMLDYLPADLVVYDVMDELANFKGAATTLPEREALLLARADLVFTGGRSLYAARKDRHLHVYCFPSGVDARHFAQALEADLPVAAEIADLPHPTLGYYGVIDERMDCALLGSLAEQHPDWSIVIVGPIVKIEPSDLPRASNLHYIGQQSYAQLPTFLKGFDVCIMPFAINDATRYISPTKTLEFMAAHKPIVSTPVPDVVENWGQVIRIGADAPSFGAAVTNALRETKAQRLARLASEIRIIGEHSWDSIAGHMRSLIGEALARRGPRS
jgi:glycosyltransferase involved in cell wall biosynthesis